MTAFMHRIYFIWFFSDVQLSMTHNSDRASIKSCAPSIIALLKRIKWFGDSWMCHHRLKHTIQCKNCWVPRGRRNRPILGHIPESRSNFRLVRSCKRKFDCTAFLFQKPISKPIEKIWERTYETGELKEWTEEQIIEMKFLTAVDL
jgi:hypothetical protein